jgi:hypothetical protein
LRPARSGNRVRREAEKEGAGEVVPAPLGMGLRLLLISTNPSGHSLVILSKANRKQGGDILEKLEFTPHWEQFTPANRQFVPVSFHFGPFRLKIATLRREPWPIPGRESRK